jgi:hypothetical protein
MAKPKKAIATSHADFVFLKDFFGNISVLSFYDGASKSSGGSQKVPGIVTLHFNGMTYCCIPGLRMTGWQGERIPWEAVRDITSSSSNST